MPRIIEFVRRWAPSNEAIEKLEDLLNDCPLPEDKSRVFDFERCIGRLEAVSAMMKGAIYNSVPDEVKLTVKSMTDLLDASIEEMNMKKTKRVAGSGKKKIILPRKSKIQVQIEQLEKEISDLESESVKFFDPMLEYIAFHKSPDDSEEDIIRETPEQKARREAELQKIEMVIAEKKKKIEELKKQL